MNRIKELMERKGIQQKELAVQMRVSQASISDWANNKKNPSRENLKELSEIFQVSPAVILGYEEIPRILPDGVKEIEEDVWEVREQLRRDPNMRLLFDAASRATPEHLRAAAAMLKALEPKDGDGE